MSKKKTYTPEFKQEALRLLETSGKPVAVVERELGLSSDLLHHWGKRFQINKTTKTLELSEVEKLKLELREAKRELARVEMERDILKKTVGIFSRGDHGLNMPSLPASLLAIAGTWIGFRR